MTVDNEILYSAARQGNLELVQDLVKNPAYDINYIHEETINAGLKEITGILKTSVLSAAVKSHNVALVEFLLYKGAKVRSEKFSDNPFHIHMDAIATVYSPIYSKSFGRFGDFEHRFSAETDVEILKKLFVKAQDYRANLVDTFWWGENLGDLLDFYKPKIRIVDVLRPLRDNKQCIKYFVHEALLRNDQEVLNFPSNEFANVQIDAESMKEYIKERDFSAQQLQTACMGVDYLVKQKKFTNDYAELIKKAIDSKLNLKIDLDNIPEQFRSGLSKPSDRSLLDLFSLIQQLLNPFIGLPGLHFENESFAKFYNDNELPEEKIIRSYQNLFHLRSYLSDRTTIEVVALFAQCQDIYGGNEAANLLGEILLYHGDDVVVIEGKKGPLLNEDQKKHGMKILHKIATLKDTDYLFIKFNHEHKHQIEEQKIEIAELNEEVAGLKEEVANQKQELQLMKEQLDLLLKSKKRKKASE